MPGNVTRGNEMRLRGGAAVKSFSTERAHENCVCCHAEYPVRQCLTSNTNLKPCESKAMACKKAVMCAVVQARSGIPRL